MRIPSLLVLALLIVAIAPASLAEARPAGDGAATAAAKQQAKGKAKARSKVKAKPRKSCRKGYVRKSVKVKRKGKMVRVQRCRKKQRKAVSKPPPATPKQPAAPAPEPEPGAPKPLFDPPGTRLTGAAAQPFFERYLHGSRFTDCPGGWPSCPSEQRYSHFANGSFFACQLPMTAGATVPPRLTYSWQDTIVNADGSWSFNAEVTGGQRPAFYDWQVAVDGTVTGVQQVPGGGGPKQIGPLRYVGAGSDCTA